jgi:hypothetical protein
MDSNGVRLKAAERAWRRAVCELIVCRALVGTHHPDNVLSWKLGSRRHVGPSGGGLGLAL